MAQGYDRRETPRAGQVAPLQAGSVPLNPVMYPRPSSQGGGGKELDNLGSLLDGASQLVQQYGEREQNKEMMDGKLAYIQGKTESDIAQNGSRYTMAGFMSMEAKTAGTEWFQNKLLDIDKTDKSIHPEEYRRSLMESYSSLLGETAGADPYTRKLMTSMADEFLPKLTTQQIQSNNKWREEQTALSAQKMLIAESNAPMLGSDDAEQRRGNLQELLGHVKTMLPQDKANAVIADAMVLNYMGGNDALEHAASSHRTAEIMQSDKAAGVPTGLHSYSLMKESNGKRLDSSGKVLLGPLVNPTGKLAERAVGERQVLPSTAKDPGFGIKPAQNDSPEEYARVGVDYLTAMHKKYGGDGTLALMAYNGSFGAVDEHMAKVGDPTKGQISIQDFVKTFPKAETRKYVAGWVEGLGAVSQQYATPQQQNAKVALMQSLSDANFDSAQIAKILNARESFITKKAQDFDAARESTEDAMLTSMKKEGNLPAYYQAVQKYKEENQLTNEWANSMATRGREQYSKYVAAQQETAKITGAISTNSVGSLSGDLKTKAIDLHSLQTQQRVAADQSIPDDKKAEAVFKEQIKFLNRNVIVDERLAKSIQGQLTTGVVDKNGAINPDVLSAYSKLRSIAEVAGPQAVSGYLGDGFVSKLYDQAMQIDIAGSGTGTALKQAYLLLTDKENGVPVATAPIKDEQIIPVIQDKLESFFPSVYKSWFRPGFNLVNGFDVYTKENKRALNDNGLMSWVKTNAQLMQDVYPNLDIGAAVTNVLRSNIGNHVEIANGNILWTDKGTSFYKQIGFTDTESSQIGSYHNVMGYAINSWLKTNGKSAWGEAFNEFNWFGQTGDDSAMLPTRLYNAIVDVPQAITDSAANKARGFPEYYARWINGPRPGVFIDLYTNTVDQGLLPKNQPRFIPAEDLKPIIANATIYYPAKNQGNIFDLFKEQVLPEWTNK